MNPQRIPQDDEEHYLLQTGWKFAGLTLFEYSLSSDIRGYYTKDQAIQMTEEYMLDVYCPMCGSCGEEDCCRPEMCKCFYSEHYNKTYRELLDEHEQFYQLVKQIADIQNDEGFIGKYIQNARKILEELGYDTD